MNFLYVVWNVNPEIFSIGSLHIRWYGLLFALGFIISYRIMGKFFKQAGFSDDHLDKLTIYVAIGTILGARFGHVFFYEPHYYLAHPGEILKIWHGGLASHGAAIGILLSLWIFSKYQKISLIWLLDRVAIVVSVTGALVRIGNLMNSEIVGKATDVPWAFAFVRDNLERGFPEYYTRHPSQIYEAGFYFVLFIVLYYLLEKRNWHKKTGYTFSLFLILLFGFRFFIEFFKDVQVSFEQQMTIDMGQWLSIPFIVAGIGLWIYAKNHWQPSGTEHKTT
jgi:prolipoprotein diacylglyceryl transferase